MGKKAVCGIVKNEERDIAEWIAFHIHAGFDTIILYDNLSTDGTVDIALTFTQYYDVRIIRWNRGDGLWQEDAYMDAISRFRDEFEWMLFVDGDEFLIQEDPYAEKLSFLDDFGRNVSQVCISWKMFGSSGHKDFPEGLVIENFLYRVPTDLDPNPPMKSFVRPQDVLHRPPTPHWFPVKRRTVTVENGDMPYIRGGEWPPAVYSKAWMHHYWTRSEAHFRIKISDWAARGDGSRSMDGLREIDRKATMRDESALPYVGGVYLVLERVGLLREIPVPRTFDPERYLALHEDVRNAGVDPVDHWKNHGCREGRRWW